MSSPHEKGIHAAAVALLKSCNVAELPDDEHLHCFKCEGSDPARIAVAVIDAYMEASIAAAAQVIIEEFKASGETKH